jgi:hypothetical protein
MDEQGKARGSRRHFMQQPEPLGRNFRVYQDACDVAAGPLKAADKSSRNRIAAEHEYYRNARACSLCGFCRWSVAEGHDRRGPALHQVCRHRPQQIWLAVAPTVLNGHIAAHA